MRIGEWKRSMAPVVATAFLAACGTEASDPPAVVVPRVVDYDQPFRDAAADAVEALPAGSPIIVLLEDCGELRAKIRALAGDG